MTNEQEKISCELIKLGLRPPEVHAITGFPLRKLRFLYEYIHGYPPPRGQAPQHVNKRIKNINDCFEIIIFFKIFKSIDKEKIYIFNPKKIITAYLGYKFISNSPLPFSTIYLLVRDIKTGWIKPKKCSICGNLYLFNHAHSAMYSCPFCKIKIKNKKRQKQKEKRFGVS